MISKQFIRSSLRAIKTQSSTVSTRVPVLAAIRPIQSTRFDATPIRWITSSSLLADESPASSQPIQESQTSQSQPTEELFSVYLSNLSFSVTEELLSEFISQYAPVKKVDVVRTSDGAARGFAFAKFPTQADADAAVSAINGLDFLGRQVVAAISLKRPVISAATNQLFMSGFPTDGESDESALRSALHEALGMQPKLIRFHKFPGGFLKGTGHIEFADESMVDAALVKLQERSANNQPILVNGHPLTLVKARPLLQPRNRARGGFGGGRGGFGGSGGYGYGAAGGYGGVQGGYGGPSGGYGGAPGGYGGAPGGYAGAQGGYGGGYNASYPGTPAAGGYGQYGRGNGNEDGGNTPAY
ncbi:uncharacterized protein MELLADRAFT_71901 [Melampsora larici-populina 98AG31]|uniref:RRM domain-containing protein n=1 Tax=Melampsora larici-populina (strain 98AG31 / pathotype 3-4-7) TaxID=747676 RepID=F4RM59_MELLP|nr:uncharacterized protein MELLADRAFT_71901 [Melampsora larici-populina 98AG31]EGG06367.1 hypothetical protein MELLADRAFT_71901 [Melampsora larici-populina 98AG31]